MHCATTAYHKERRRLWVGWGLIAAALVSLAGCGSIGVQPWQRDLLAQDAMVAGGNPVDAAMDAHIYFSKEASTGGAGVGGGGCGCN